MFEIIRKLKLSEKVVEFRVSAPEVAAKAQAGHFIVVRNGERGERIPLTIADWDREGGTIDMVVQAVGRSTIDLAALDAGDAISDLVGPLGRPAVIEAVKEVWCVAGGIGAAPVYPQARAYRSAGARVVSILGARSADLITWEDHLSDVSEQIILCTEDGSRGEKGLVTDVLRRLLAEGRRPDRVLAIGPVPMMRAVCDVTRPLAVPTTVSLNALMVDGTGMCGGCRVTVGGETRFSCVDGPDFDGHQVDFEELSNRQKAYRALEKQALEAAPVTREGCGCRRG